MVLAVDNLDKGEEDLGREAQHGTAPLLGVSNENVALVMGDLHALLTGRLAALAPHELAHPVTSHTLRRLVRPADQPLSVAQR